MDDELPIGGKQQQHQVSPRHVRFSHHVMSLCFGKGEPTINLSRAWTRWQEASLLAVGRPPAHNPPPGRLEHVAIDDSGEVWGRVAVASTAIFSKAVTVRLSADRWRSFVDVEAAFVRSDLQAGLDVFEFVIDVANCDAAADAETGEVAIELAIKCSMDGTDVWDNNGGNNYRLVTSAQLRPPEHAECVPLKGFLGDCDTMSSCDATASVYANYFLPSAFSPSHDKYYSTKYTFNWSFS